MLVLVSVAVHPLLQRADNDRSVCFSTASGKMYAGTSIPTIVRSEPTAVDCITASLGSATCRDVLGVQGTILCTIALSLSLTITSVLPESAMAGDSTGTLIIFVLLVI